MLAIPQRSLWLLFGAAASLSLGACSTVTDSTRSALEKITPYRVEVVQGNFVSKEQVAALKPGMSRQQVREILGTSLLTDVFHSDRWDYVFTMRRQGVEPQQRRLTLFFKNDALDRFEGDTMPSEEEFVAAVDTRASKTSKIPQLEATESQLDKFKPDDKKAAKTEAPAAPLAPLPPSYPPLETAR
ncbi:outer membrane protein assembly factor BamE [Variovorax sp. PAMC 28711]|uniref:outer membrane protein assembly factor BamE n=1 Tax=Variovorax sp. PAMC 28711 TaxID=1795631 RepID=UPI00078B4C1E|nr:outer membrane protein assembly factor BamE [Variovorax sp. PAMC 28711]AMM24968.1 cell envelope protein SmpA [Variovorax sp. PAMC 28711]